MACYDLETIPNLDTSRETLVEGLQRLEGLTEEEALKLDIKKLRDVASDGANWATKEGLGVISTAYKEIKTKYEQTLRAQVGESLKPEQLTQIVLSQYLESEGIRSIDEMIKQGLRNKEKRLRGKTYRWNGKRSIEKK